MTTINFTFREVPRTVHLLKAHYFLLTVGSKEDSPVIGELVLTEEELNTLPPRELTTFLLKRVEGMLSRVRWDSVISNEASEK